LIRVRSESFRVFEAEEKVVVEDAAETIIVIQSTDLHRLSRNNVA
jgi:hypothetical protein